MRLTMSAAAPLCALASVLTACAENLRLITAQPELVAQWGCGNARLTPDNQWVCEKVMAELKGETSVTIEFSDRYQAVAAPIQIWTRSWITHVDFVLPDGRLLGATPFGVRIRRWTPALHSVRYRFTADPKRVYGFALAQLGKRYNYIGDLGYALKSRALHDDDAWFCSELVEAAAEAGGVNLSGKAPRWTSPALIRSSVLLSSASPAMARIPVTSVAVAAAQPKG